jgi:hypothetical protein
LKSFRAVRSGSRDIARAAGDKGVDIVDAQRGFKLGNARRIKPFPTSSMKKAATHPAGNSLQAAANSLLALINSLFGAN